MIEQQQKMVLSPYLEIYELAIPPIRMFKYLLLKSIYDLSDVDVVERSKYDMSFKYFLDMAPEEAVINSSSLTKFRKRRLKDMNLLDMLIAKTVQIALDKGILKSKSIIVDATHTKSRCNQKTPRQALQDQSKRLRRVIKSVGRIYHR
jgi:transposase